jgi:hypothetical protein
MMPYHMWYDPKDECVVARMSGEVGLPLVQAVLSEEVILAERNHCTRILYDMRSADPHLSEADISQVPKLASEAGVKLWFKEAIVANGHRAELSYLQAVSEHEGQEVRVFDTVSAARNWLRS